MGITLYGRSARAVKMPHVGKLEQLPFAIHEIGQFCTALAIEDLIDEMRLHQSGAGHVIRSQEDVLSEIIALRQRGIRPLFANSGNDSELARVIR